MPIYIYRTATRVSDVVSVCAVLLSVSPLAALPAASVCAAVCLYCCCYVCWPVNVQPKCWGKNVFLYNFIFLKIIK